MRYTKTLITTTRNAPKEATMQSHVLLLRGGYVRMLSKGVYSFLPLGVRTLGRIAAVVREEMNRAGAQELLMPFVHPAELWRESGRWESFGDELLKFKNREGGECCIGPTHEEVITDIARRELRSYRQLPINLYQVQTKYRDEPRPRAGLLRCREFVMKDAYSFDVTREDARASYRAMLAAYARIMARLGLSFKVVRADTGAIGGDLSHEFQVITPAGEDTLVLCDACGYAVNIEMAPCGAPAPGEPPAGGVPARREVETPAMRTVEEVARFLDLPARRIVKTLIVVHGDSVVAALVRGDRELNLLKLGKLLGARNLFLAGDAEVERATGAPVGFAGPVGLPLPVYADREVMEIADGACGANRADAHLVHVAAGRDFAPAAVGDIRKAEPGDPCPDCGAPLATEKGIEGGQTFYLGTIYSGKMGACFIDADGREKPFEMGCYGIGVSRLMAAAVEQFHDERGISWPVSVAPYQVVVLPLGDDERLRGAAAALEEELERAGIETLVDDRGESPGVKFYDADLLGLPLQVVIGNRSMKEGKVEIRRRDGTAKESVGVDAAAAAVRRHLDELRGKLDEHARAWAEKIHTVAKI